VAVGFLQGMFGNNPGMQNAMQQMMQNPMMQQMMSNPEMLRAVMNAHPGIREVS
jgi:ubiquilin